MSKKPCFRQSLDRKHGKWIQTHLQGIQMQLSQKQKTFSELFFAYLKSKFNFKQFPKKHDPHRSCISRNTGSGKHG